MGADATTARMWHPPPTITLDRRFVCRGRISHPRGCGIRPPYEFEEPGGHDGPGPITKSDSVGWHPEASSEAHPNVNRLAGS